MKDLKDIILTDLPKRISTTACKRCGGGLAKLNYCNHCGPQDTKTPVQSVLRRAV